MCHHVKHIGLAGILADKGELGYDELIKHFCRVNTCTERDFEEIRYRTFEIWENRSQYEWKQDFGKYADSIEK